MKRQSNPIPEKIERSKQSTLGSRLANYLAERLDAFEAIIIFLQLISMGVGVLLVTKIETSSHPNLADSWEFYRQETPKISTALNNQKRFLSGDHIDIYLYSGSEFENMVHFLGTDQDHQSHLYGKHEGDQSYQDVYRDQTEEHIYGRCFEVNLDKTKDHAQIAIDEHKNYPDFHSVYSCPVYEQRFQNLIGFVSVTYEDNPPFSSDRVIAALKGTADIVGDFLSKKP